MTEKRDMQQAGFTIVELMIATTVLSVILLLATVILSNIGGLYYKGINESRTQDNVRGITDQVSQDLKYTGGDFTGPTTENIGGQSYDYFCIGDVRYTYVIGEMIGSGTDTDGTTAKSPHVLWRDTSGCSSRQRFLSGTELINPNSRLTYFSVGPSIGAPAGTFQIQVGVAYGDIDLINDPDSLDASCKGGTGDQFCATASLTTTVVQRIASGGS
jgi:prepilin-type N-terminal cleavage/methylation domain-containing protein